MPGLASKLAGAAVVILIATAARVCAAELVVGPGDQLQAALDRAADGDTVVVDGEHRGGVRIDRKITLEGRKDAVIDGEGRGSVVFVAAPGAVVRGLTLRGSGRDLVALDAGVYVEKTATGAVIEANRIEGNLYGICLHGAENAIARGNTIVGLAEGRINEAGNGVSVWNAPGARVDNNDIRFGRDGIFVVASKRNSFTGNRFRDLRFAVHYMYTDDSEISYIDREYGRLCHNVLTSPDCAWKRFRWRPGPRPASQFRQQLRYLEQRGERPAAVRGPLDAFGDARA